MTGAAEFALKTDTIWIEWPPWYTAFRTSVVVIVTEVACAMVEPATDCIDEARRIEFVNDFGESPLRTPATGLTPAFVEDDLERTSWLVIHSLSIGIFRESGR